MRAVIMGGTSGIGLATAERLTREGMEVTVTGRDAERLAAAAPCVASAVALDGADPAAVAAFFAGHGAFEHLVLAFSPGALGLGPIRDTRLEDVEAAFRGKLFGYIQAIRTAQVSASITMVSGAAAGSASPGTVTIAAVNGALDRMVPPLAAELAPVRVNAVRPGVVDTPWWSFVAESERASQLASYTAATPVGRAATSDEVAHAIAFLISAPMVTGAILPVDGGMTVA